MAIGKCFSVIVKSINLMRRIKLNGRLGLKQINMGKKIVGNISIVLNFYQKRPIFALKKYPRPQRHIRE